MYVCVVQSDDVTDPPACRIRSSTDTTTTMTTTHAHTHRLQDQVARLTARSAGRTARRESDLGPLEEEEEEGEGEAEEEEDQAAVEEFRAAVAEAEQRILEMVRLNWMCGASFVVMRR